MNTIFLDIDEVLNCDTSKSYCGQYVGIDKDKTQILSHIVKETDSEIILTSTWKVGWEPYRHYNSELYPEAKYLDNHLKKKGDLKILNKTREKNLLDRGTGIVTYLHIHPEIKNYVILDDEIFPDFNKFPNKIFPHLVQTNTHIGLTEKDAELAIKILKGEIRNLSIGNNNIILEKFDGPQFSK